MTTIQETWEDFARAGRLEDAILAYVGRVKHATLAELQDALGRYFEVRGDWEWEGFPNGFIWAGMSEEFVQAVRQLVHQGRLELEGASLMCYLMDGRMLALPLGKRAPRDKTRGYAKPRWLPTAVRLAHSKEE
jgi:hypothetical protein